jgi:replication-associated recombination protein RarA
MRDIEKEDIGEIPMILQDKNYQKPENGSQGESLYIYPPANDYQTDQEYMPTPLIGRKYYIEREG